MVVVDVARTRVFVGIVRVDMHGNRRFYRLAPAMTPPRRFAPGVLLIMLVTVGAAPAIDEARALLKSSVR